MAATFITPTPLGRLPTEVRVAVVSDLHAYDQAQLGAPDNAPSFFEIGAPEDRVREHPIAGLLNLIDAEGLEADLLLCPGDLGDRSHPAAVKHAWDRIQAVASRLKVAHILATAGNHDVDSRHGYNSHDARGYLQSLQPPFPFNDEFVFDRYWSRHFAVLSWPDVRLVTLNSSAYHGDATPPDRSAAKAAPEYAHGRIATSTVDYLKQCLATETPDRLNILLCHHHPQPLEEFGLGADDIMTGGADLLRTLGDGTFGEWVIIHGHKHYPKLSYAQGDTSVTPIVFAAGSLCARLQPEIQGKARNQFYLMTFHTSKRSQFGLVGRFRAWDWNHGIGWQPAQMGSGLPHEGGFGIRDKPDQLAARIVTECGRRRQTDWNALLHKFPTLAYLLPKDLERVIQCIRKSTHLHVIGDAGRIIQIDRLT